MWENSLSRLLKINYPIIQAPMAGGPTTTELVAAVSTEGGLGMIGAGYLSPDQLRSQIQEIHKLTDKPFGINLFVPKPYTADGKTLRLAGDLLKPIREELQVGEDLLVLPTFEQDVKTFEEQLKIIIEEQISICSFTFGIPSPQVVTKLKENSIVVIGTATTVEEAILNEKAGMDAVVVQGAEAGGHRGTFYGHEDRGLIGLMSLIPQVFDVLDIPLIAAGGIMDGRGIMAAKCLGAIGVQMGTAFLVCKESGANALHKEAIMEATEDQVVLTRAFSGKMARGLNNGFIEIMSQKEEELPDYPLQNELTKAIRKNAAAKGSTEYMSLWSGQSPRLAKKLTVRQLMNKIILEAETLHSKL
ncbi:2-nitropropane dioxygenase NPD [Neobacillus bataviensis LMG 21833]|uniref:Probable nitronate monooxygenase n=1 Tax=Neobacillus bataviensis LMG 21833 TaxID=1117379 RepID=K6E9M7_9BACI|nr:nitronate monooxygenase [Neobacillus bataviensis]EKN70056.1 2-nitropropane dioxygenase NPD [Neobacillus bataviensis LMG 21833]